MASDERTGSRATSRGTGLLGTLLAAGGACSFGVTIAIGRSLARAGLGAPTVLGIRFTGAALALLALRGAGRRDLAPPAGERLRALLLGAVYAAESTLFFMALERGTAAAVALLFYSYPVIVTVIETVRGAGRPPTGVVGALALSATGSVIVVVAGGHVAIATAGVVFALASSTTFAAYLIVSDRLLVHTDAATTAAWVALGCGVSHLARGVLTAGLRSPAGHWPALAGNAIATASAFTLMFAGLRLLGPSRTAVVMTLEAFFAIVFAAVFLHEALGGIQVLGGVAILGGAAIVATSRPPAELVGASADAP